MGKREGKSGRYEITMYKLLVMFVVSIFLAIGLGIVLGQEIGESRTLSELDVPPYCSVQSDGGTSSIKCAELSNVSATDLCSLFSTPVKSKLKVLIIN